jgi:transcriptional regulator with XRE-family HTH domain
MPRCITDIDREIAGRVRAARVAAKLTQTDLGNALGVSFQQVGKYDRGQDRYSAGMLQLAAECIGVPVASFYADATPREMTVREAREAMNAATDAFARAMLRSALAEAA